MVLTLKSLGIHNVLEFDYLDKPEQLRLLEVCSIPIRRCLSPTFLLMRQSCSISGFATAVLLWRIGQTRKGQNTTTTTTTPTPTTPTTPTTAATPILQPRALLSVVLLTLRLLRRLLWRQLLRWLLPRLRLLKVLRRRPSRSLILDAEWSTFRFLLRYPVCCYTQWTLDSKR